MKEIMGSMLKCGIYFLLMNSVSSFSFTANGWSLKFNFKPYYLIIYIVFTQRMEKR